MNSTTESEMASGETSSSNSRIVNINSVSAQHFTGYLTHNYYGDIPPQIEDQEAAEGKFIFDVKAVLDESTRYDEGSRFSRHLHEEQSVNFPKMVVVDMDKYTKDRERRSRIGASGPIASDDSNDERLATGLDDKSRSTLNNAMNIDLHEASFETLHDNENKRGTNHVMVAGDTGEGKTIFAKAYARFVSGNTKAASKSLHDVVLVHYVQVANLCSETNSTAFNLLFSQQADLSEESQYVGEQWLNSNAEKTLLVLDGIDQSVLPFGGKYPKINSKTPAKANTILANIFSGAIFKGIKILSTLRWHTYWNLHNEQKPAKTVALRGFTDEQIKSLIIQLSGESDGQRVWSYLCEKDSDLLSLCKTPMFLLYVTEVIKSDPSDPPRTLSELIVSVLRYFVGSDHESGVPQLMKKLGKLAYHGVFDNRFVFTPSYIEKLGLDPRELQDLVETQADIQPLQQFARGQDLMIRFCHQSIQEVLAALHICNLPPAEFDRLFEQLKEPKMENVWRISYGILLNRRTAEAAYRFIEDDRREIAERQEIAKTTLMRCLAQNTIRDVKILYLMRECGDTVVADFAPHVQKIDVSGSFNKYIETNIITSTLMRFHNLDTVSLEGVELEPNVIRALRSLSKNVRIFVVSTRSGLCPHWHTDFRSCVTRLQSGPHLLLGHHHAS